jgi:hypothetical protein
MQGLWSSLYTPTFTVAIMTWLTVMEYLRHNDHGYVPLVVNTSESSPHS